MAEQTENGNGFGVQPIRKKLPVLKDVDVEKPVLHPPEKENKLNQIALNKGRKKKILLVVTAVIVVVTVTGGLN